VVVFSLGVPISCAGKLRWQTARMFGDAAMAELCNGVVEAAMAEPINNFLRFYCLVKIGVLQSRTGTSLSM
jgi:hypothetical protein